jgi:hypothetical protein
VVQESHDVEVHPWGCSVETEMARGALVACASDTGDDGSRVGDVARGR